MLMTYETDDTLYEYTYTQDGLCALIEYHDPFQCAVLTPAELLQANGQAPASEAADTDYTGAYPAVWAEDVC